MKTSYSFPELQSELQSGTVSCVDRVLYHLSQIKAKKHLNAFLEIYEDEALSRAAEIDKKIKAGTSGKLAGMVVGIKDVLCYKDHQLHAGSKMLSGFISQFTATAVQRLLDQDAIIIGRQNCDEFAMGSSNENSAFGPVLNPIDNSRVPGGSSGGSAAAVAADMCQVSIGSDTGGSVRQPAAFCGVIGLKPTYSRVSRHGLVAYGSSFDCIGIFSKQIEDVALVLSVIAGHDDFDSTVSRQAVPDYSSGLSENEQFKIAYIESTVSSDALQEDTRTAILDAIASLKADGHTVEAVDFPLLSSILPTYYILATAEASSNLSRYDGVRFGHRSGDVADLPSLYKKSRSEGFGKEVQRRILLGTFVLSSNYYDAYYTKAQKVRRMIRDKTKAILSQYDFILTPAAPSTAFKLGAHSDNPVEMYLADLFSVQANVAGVPGISFPYGKDRQGLPIGVQALTDDFQEKKLLKLAKLLTKS